MGSDTLFDVVAAIPAGPRRGAADALLIKVLLGDESGAGFDNIETALLVDLLRASVGVAHTYRYKLTEADEYLRKLRADLGFYIDATSELMRPGMKCNMQD